jgi:hypothetical protein
MDGRICHPKANCRAFLKNKNLSLSWAQFFLCVLKGHYQEESVLCMHLDGRICHPQANGSAFFEKKISLCLSLSVSLSLGMIFSMYAEVTLSYTICALVGFGWQSLSSANSLGILEKQNSRGT